MPRIDPAFARESNTAARMMPSAARARGGLQRGTCRGKGRESAGERGRESEEERGREEGLSGRRNAGGRKEGVGGGKREGRGREGVGGHR
eukprot:2813654-Rhodomonas_salina.2